tara:strand:+ start:1181 stop:1840 length:660 start_codon:yes stop_codon:yes gene_type:complete
MGFLNHSTNNIVIDAVLTNKGREAIANNEFAVAKFALSDDEVDYTIIKKYGRVVGKEKIEKNTPIFEATTSAKVGLKYFLTDDTTAAGGVAQILQGFSVSLDSGQGVNTTANEITYATSGTNTTETFTITINEDSMTSALVYSKLISSTNSNTSQYSGPPYTYEFNSTFLGYSSSIFTINAAAKNRTEYHNSEGKLVLPITVKNANGYSATIYITIAFA